MTQKLPSRVSSRLMLPVIFGIGIIMLVIDVAIGSFAFPMTKTETLSEPTTLTATQTVVSMVTQTMSMFTSDTTHTQNITCRLVIANGSRKRLEVKSLELRI